MPLLDNLMRSVTRPQANRHGANRVLLVCGVVLVAANLRPAITCVGPLIGIIQHDAGLSSSQAGLLNTLPLLMFAAVSAFAPRWARRFGLEPLLFLALAALMFGTAARSLPFTAALFAGTGLLGAGIACGNVLLPALIKRDFPTNVATMTAVYATTLSAAAAVSSGVAVPIADSAAGGWRTSLGGWALLAVAGLALWTPQLRHHTRPKPVAAIRGLGRSPLAWQVTLFMGLQSFTFYSIVTWLPSVLQSRGYSAVGAGWQLFVYQLVSLAASATVPRAFPHFTDQRAIAALTSATAAVAFTGLAVGPFPAMLWVILGGLASGSALTLALSFFALRTSTPAQASALSGMAQSVGYGIAAVGPTVFGLLHDISSQWQAPLLMLGATALVQIWVSLGAGRDHTIAQGARM